MDETQLYAEPTNADAKDQAGPSRAELQQYDQMAKIASAELMARKGVESAIVEISGGPSELILHLRCALVAETDPSSVMELIDHVVIPNAERVLDETFSSRDLRFTVAPRS